MRDLGYTPGLYKESEFVAVLGPEMKSTGDSTVQSTCRIGN